MCVLPPDANDRYGGASYSYRWWHVPCRPGSAYFLEPDTLHANDRLFGPSNYYVIRVAGSTVAALGRELGLGDRPHFRVAFTDSPRLMSALAALCTTVAGEADELERETLLIHALRVALESAEVPAREPSAASGAGLARAREYLHAHSTTSVSLSELAEVSGLSRYHLVRSFARAYGLSPHAYLNQLRVAAARRQLEAGVPASAVEVGFFDQSHLTRHFKRAYAVTPAAYQRAISW